MSIDIRKGKKDDLNAVFSLVKELAEYENEPDSVKTTADYYVEQFEKKLFSTIVAEKDGEIIGIAIFYDTFSTWRGKMLYLEDFVVREAYRKTGVGQLIFDAFIQEAHDRDCKMVKWQVLDWNTPAIKFYEKNEATIEKEWWNGKIIFSTLYSVLIATGVWWWLWI